jgi:hypothetical protein
MRDNTISLALVGHSELTMYEGCGNGVWGLTRLPSDSSSRILG